MKTRILMLLLCAAFLLGCLAGCGAQPASDTEAAAETPVSAGDTSAAEPEAQPGTAAGPETEAVSAEEPEDAPEPEEPAFTIEYPLEGSPSFEVLYAKPTILEATVMNGLDYDFSAAYPAMVEATGVKLSWKSVSEQAWETQISLIIAAGDYPDACADRITYTTGNIGLIEDEVALDISGMLEEHMPNYYALLQSDSVFSDCA